MVNRTWARTIALAAVAAACGDEGTIVGTGDVVGGILEPPPEGEGFQLGFDVSVYSGSEIEYCHYFVLPTVTGEWLDVASFEHAYSAGTHHLHLYLTNYAPEDVDLGEAFPCSGESFAGLGITGAAYAAQTSEGSWTYPEDVALKLHAGDVVMLQTHYINTTDDVMTASVRVNLNLAPAPATTEAGTLLFYDWAIVVPPNENATAKMSCAVPGDVDLIFAMSHTHKHAVGYRAHLAGPGLPEPELIYQTDKWQNIEPVLFQPNKHVTSGQTIDVECDYRGEATRAIVEGPSAQNNEMCVFVASYYPRVEGPVEQCQGAGSGPQFAGSETCGDALTCMMSTDDPVEKEECVMSTCATSAETMRAFVVCGAAHCSDDCVDEASSSCQSCMMSECETQIDDCFAATCS